MNRKKVGFSTVDLQKFMDDFEIIRFAKEIGADAIDYALFTSAFDYRNPDSIYSKSDDEIADHFTKVRICAEENGIEINELYAAGGIAVKSPFLMQIYADVMNRTIVVSDSSQAGARGSALYAAVAAGECSDIIQAAQKYAQPNKLSYDPIPENVKLYEALYQEYRRLHDYFGAGGNDVMDRLYDIYYAGQA